MNDTHRWIALDAGGALGTEEDVAWSDVADRTTTVLLHHRDDPADPAHHLVVQVPDGAKTVRFRRISATTEVLPDGGLGGESQTEIHVVGWDGPSGKVYVWVHRDGSVLVTDHDVAGG